MHALSPPPVIAVSWIISEPIEFVGEGEEARVELFAQAFGLYASPIEIGVVCEGVIDAGVPPGEDTISITDTLEHAIIYHMHFAYLFAAYLDRDFVVLSGSTLEFTDIETLRTNSSNKVVLSIINDQSAEPCESFICTLQGGAVD